MDSLSYKNNGREIRRQLRSLPSDLHSTYDDAIHRIELQKKDDRLLAYSIIMWITTASRPLTFPELQQALGIHPEDRTFDIDSNSEHPWRLLSLCAGLVVVEEAGNIVRLIRECCL